LDKFEELQQRMDDMSDKLQEMQNDLQQNESACPVGSSERVPYDFNKKFRRKQTGINI